MLEASRTYDAPMDSRPGTAGHGDDNMPILKRKLEQLGSQEADMDELEALGERTKRIKGEYRSMVHALQEGGSLASQQQIKRVDDLRKEIKDILGRCGFRKGSTTHPAGCQKSLTLVKAELVGDKTEKTIKKICYYLMQDETFIIGIWGIGGVGKTAILMHVHNRLLEYVYATFNDVFWVTVRQKLNIFQLQDEIANAVGLENISKYKDVKRRACILNRHLKGKRAVLILDGLWMHFDVEDVGLPVVKEGIKLVLTTRSQDVCHKMLCQKQIKIEPLSSLDSWSLFLEKLCFGRELTPKIREMARFIVDKCRGLPLGIIEIANCMRGVDQVHGWRDMLRKFKDSRVELDVFKRLKLSYVKLGDSQVQRCFLHLTLCFGFQVDPPDDIEDPPDDIKLIESLIDEDLLGVIGTRQELHDQGNAILDKLRKDCLWNFMGEGYPIVHPLIRDMALHMVDSTTHMAKAYRGLKEIPEEKFWTSSLEKVYLQGNEIEDIPYGMSPNCPKLTRLSLNHNVSLKDIHKSFFRHLNGLKVVDLSCTGLEKLPEAICQLESLEALLLRGCEELRHIPCVRQLESLKRLDLRGCENLQEVPEGMEALVKLRYLDLRDTQIEALPERVLAKMVNLQYMAINYVKAEEEEESESIESESTEVEEEESESTEVEGLYCSTRNVETYNAYVSILEQHNFRRYRLVLSVPGGDYFYRIRKGYRNRIIVIDSCHSFATRGDGEIGGNGCALIPKNVQMLQIGRFGGETNLCQVGQLEELEQLEELYIEEWEELEELGAVHFRHLWELHISWCSKLKHLWGEGQVLPSLQSLEIKGLEELEGIDLAAPRLERMTLSRCGEMKRAMEWDSLITHLPNLKRISIEDCEKVEEIIGGSYPTGATATSLLEDLYISGCPSMKGVLRTHDGCPHLPSLQTIEVRNCKGVEVIIGTATPYTTPSSSSYFPMLSKLTLVDLPELKSICDGTLSCDSIRSIRIWGCPKLERIPITRPLLLNDGTPYLHPSLPDISINLQYLKISGCHNMKGVLLTHDVWPHLPFLQKIEVHDCKGIEMIIGTADPNTTPSFPNLIHLLLWDLPELKSICDRTLSCDSIDSIVIRGCPKLKRIPLQLLPPPSLRGIWTDEQTWQRLEWNNNTLVPSLLQPFLHFI